MSDLKKSWDLEKFKCLVESLGRNFPENSFNTLHWKFFQMNYHGDEALRLLNEFQNEEGVAIIISRLEDFSQKSYSHFVAFAHAFDTVYDILLQIINRVCNDNPLGEEKVYSKKVMDILVSQNYSSTSSAIDNFYKNDSVEYLNAFINKEKHQNLVDFTNYFNVVEPLVKPNIIIMIKSFDKKCKNYPEKCLSDVIRDYPNIIYEELKNIGNAINTDLQFELDQRQK